MVALLVAAAVAGVAAWVVTSQPEWYQRIRYPLRYEAIVRTHARNYDLPPALLAAVIYTESQFDASARSEAGAVGLMQLLPDDREGDRGANRRRPLRRDRPARPGDQRSLRRVVPAAPPRPLRRRRAHGASPPTTPARGTSTRGGAGASASSSPRRATYVKRVLDAEQVYADAYGGELSGA